MRASKRLFLLIFFLLLFFPSTGRAKVPLSLSVYVDKDAVSVGDEIVYEITANHSAHVVVHFPEDGADFTPFELKRYRPLPRRELGDQVIEVRRYVLTIFRVGNWKIPSLSVPYTDYRERSPLERSPTAPLTQDGVRGFLSTEPVVIRVESVLGEGTQPALDIERLKTPERNLFWVWVRRIGWTFFAVGAVALGLYGAVRLSPRPVPRMSREDPALSALEELSTFQKALLSQTLTKRHCEALSDLLRRYLARQFDPLTLDLTTSELYRRISEYPPSKPVADEARQILETLDLVKFANRGISKEAFERVLNGVSEVIRETQAPSSGPAPP